MTDEHVHDYKPYGEMRNGEFAWIRRLTSTPQYPFLCPCGNVIYRTAERAAEDGLVLLMEHH